MSLVFGDRYASWESGVSRIKFSLLCLVVIAVLLFLFKYNLFCLFFQKLKNRILVAHGLRPN